MIKNEKLKRAFALMVLTMLASGVFSQTTPNAKLKKEKIEAQKVAFLTEKLQLTTEQSQKFWPVYNEYSAKKEVLSKAYRTHPKGFRKAELTETQADSVILADIQHEQAMLDLKKEYIAKFKGVLPSSKVAKLANAEREFRKMLLKLVREGRKAEKKGDLPDK